MKKLLTITALSSLAIVGYSQGVVSFANTAVNGSVDLQQTASASSLELAPSFTAALFYIPTATTTPATGVNAYGQLSYASFQNDGFTLAKQTASTSAGTFNAGTTTLTGLAGGYSGGNYTVQDVLAIAAWTGGYANLAAAVAANAAYGIITFVNNIGPGGSAPQVPLLTGWNALTPTPAVATFEGGNYPDLVMAAAPVPEPTTLALAGLSGASLLLFRRKK